MLRPKYWLLINSHTMRSDIVKWLIHTSVCTLFILFTCVITDFLPLPSATQVNDILSAGYHFVEIGITLWAFLLLLSLLPPIAFCTLYTIFGGISAILAFFRYKIGFAFNTIILDVIFQTDFTVSADVLSWQLFVWIVLFVITSVILSRKRYAYKIQYKHLASIIIIGLSSVCLIIFTSNFSPLANSVRNHLPFNIYSVTQDYLSERQEIKTERPSVFSYATTSEDLIVVAIIGEALRSDHLHCNGYKRQTTPRLEQLGIVSFDNIYSEYIHTNRSVPHILTRADSLNPDRAFSEPSFIDVFKAADYQTTFIANQNPEKPYFYFFSEADTSIRINSGRSFVTFDKWLDGDMLPLYNNIIQRPYNKQLIILHCIGSHWWYNAHFVKTPDMDSLFTPIVESRVISGADSMAIVNSYDNTILYTDYFLSQVIASLKHKNAIVLFLSDHGEALGEDGKWLHASDPSIKALHETASFVWFSDIYKKKYPTFVAAAHKNCCQRYRTDYFYHSIIDGAHIQTDILDTTFSIFRE